MKTIKRNDELVKTLCEQGTVLTGTCVTEDISDIFYNGKLYRSNILIRKIIFTYNNEEFCIEHCWLQERDYPIGLDIKVRFDQKYYIEFKFYAYRDAIDRGMHGMTVSFAELY